MIGQLVMFHKIQWKNGDRGVDKIMEYTGLVRDKIQVVDRIEGRLYKCDKYIVELEDGILTHFFCDEAVKIIHPQTKLEL